MYVKRDNQRYLENMYVKMELDNMYVKRDNQGYLDNMYVKGRINDI